MEEETSFFEMANRLMKTWTEVGTQASKSWFDLMGSAVHNPITDSIDLESSTQRFIGYQQLQFRLLELSFNAWQDLLPKIESGEEWQQSLNNYTQKLRTQVEEFSRGTLKNSQDRAELWQIYIKEMQKSNQLWVNALRASIEPLSQIAGTSTSEPWIEQTNLYWNLLCEDTFSSLMQIPLLGPSREFNGKLMRAFDAWEKLYPTSIAYQVVLAEVQMQSFQELMRELILLAEKGETVKDRRQFQQLWGHIADEVFEKAFCSEDNLKVRGRFLNALNHYKLCQQELMEVWMKMMNMPLRSEVDEIHKSIYELRKEVKSLTIRSEEDEIHKSISELRKEVNSLKKTLAKYEAQAQSTPPDQPKRARSRRAANP